MFLSIEYDMELKYIFHSPFDPINRLGNTGRIFGDDDVPALSKSVSFLVVTSALSGNCDY